MFKNFKAFLPAFAIAFLGFGAVPAFATATTTFNFAGNCEDCALAAGVPSYAVTGTLVLQNYTLGTNLALGNFHSFTYGPTNLIPGGFSWVQAQMLAVTGYFSLNGGSDYNQLIFSINLVTNNDANGTSEFFGGPSTRPPETEDETVYDFVAGRILSTPGGDKELNETVLVDDYGSGAWSTNSQQPIPEPGSLLLMGGALAALGLAQRRKSNRRWA